MVWNDFVVGTDIRNTENQLTGMWWIARQSTQTTEIKQNSATVSATTVGIIYTLVFLAT